MNANERWEILKQLVDLRLLSANDYFNILDKSQEEWDSWVKAQNSKLVKVLK